MSTRILRTLVILSILALTNALHAHVNVLYPVGNETFIQGNTVVIEWQIAQQHELLDWDVYYSIDSGQNWIALAINLPPNVLTYEWEIPTVETTLGQVRVYMNNAGDDYIDYSGLFTIVPNTSPPYVDIEAEDIIIPCNVGNQQAAIDAWLNNHGNANIENYCGNLIWTHDYTGLSNDCGATGISFVTFTATDQCGSTETTAQLSVQDVTGPTIATPASNLTVETNGQGNIAERNAWLSSNGGATATDACGSITWTNNFATLNMTCGSSGSATVTFTATDACGNISNTLATFTITDQVNPTLTQAAASITIPSGPGSDLLLLPWLSNHGGANASDIGGQVTWSHNYTGISDGCGATGSATVTFTAADPCGNTISTIATVQLVDQTPPDIKVPAANKVIHCAAANTQEQLQQWLSNHAGANATDESGGVTWQHNFTALADGCGSTGFAAVVFTAMDECGNTSTTAANVEVIDQNAPSLLSLPADTAIFCGAGQAPVIQSWLDRQGGGDAADPCGAVTWSHNAPSLPSACSGTSSHTVTFIARDECLNSVERSATIMIMDTTVTAIDDNPFKAVRIFPNPVDEVLQIELPAPLAIDVTLQDLTGKAILAMHETASLISLPVHHLLPGMYVLRLESELVNWVRVVIIN